MNFRSVDVSIGRRAFLVGPNASGKSNFLDALRFLREIAEPEGSFQRAVKERNGVPQIRSLHARQQSNIAIEIEIEAEPSDERWTYRLEFTQNRQREAAVVKEMVRRGDSVLVDRPKSEDKDDPSLLSQTHLEQVISNRGFRELVSFLCDIRYQHIVPHLIRHDHRGVPDTPESAPFGSGFLERVMSTADRTRKSRLKKIRAALQVAVPQLKQLEVERDSTGVPHLRGLYEHWRPEAGWQNEAQFSDGTLRLFGLLWSLLDGTGPLLLEEPELSLHPGIVRLLAPIMARVGGKKYGRQVLMSTHSPELLADQGIGAEEVLLLIPGDEGTIIRPGSSIDEVSQLMATGLTASEVILPRAAPRNVQQLALFDN